MRQAFRSLFLGGNVILVIRLPRNTVAVEQASFLVCLLFSCYLSAFRQSLPVISVLVLKEEKSASFPFR